MMLGKEMMEFKLVKNLTKAASRLDKMLRYYFHLKSKKQELNQNNMIQV
jgi:hypothetical protein